jgi:hypothetical protein
MAEQAQQTQQRPLVLPDVYSGEGSFVDWARHFDNVADVNNWKAEQKLLWLKVRLGGKAQTAFQKLPADAQGSFDNAIAALKERFEPASQKQLYIAKFYARKRGKTEGWADFADDLRVLVDKAYLDLDQNAKQLITLQQYLGQVEDSQLSFAIKQRTPRTVEEAVQATLELESYRQPKPAVPVHAVDPSDALQRVVEREDIVLRTLSDILGRLEKLEAGTKGSQDWSQKSPMPRYQTPTPRATSSSKSTDEKSVEKEIVCHRCKLPCRTLCQGVCK